jgi:hypothetical protein
MRIDIAGRGVAAAVSGLMAARAGHHVSVELASDIPERIVAIPRATVDLIEELTGVSIAKVLPSRWLRKRYVAWDDQRFSVMPHETLAFDAQALANVISNRIEKLAPESAISPNNISRYWKLVAGGRGTSASRIIAGARHAATGWVAQLPGLDESAMLVASVPQGWLVACPHPTGGISLATVNPATEKLTPHDALLQAVDHIWRDGTVKVEMRCNRWVSAAPSFEPACVSTTQIAVGEAAITFDPILGDGVGHAIRSALLARSVMAAIASGANERDCLAHYRSRLAHAFVQHLRNSAAHYGVAWNFAVWREEITLMQKSAGAMPFLDPLALRLEGSKLICTDN